MHEGNSFIWFGLSFQSVRKLKTEEVEQMLEAFQYIQNLPPTIPVDMIDFGLDILCELRAVNFETVPELWWSH